MELKKFITNSYIEEIYDSFRGKYTDEEYSTLLQEAIETNIGQTGFTLLKLEAGVGLALLIELKDGMKIHVKVLKENDSLLHQEACCDIQNFLHRNHFPCTVPIGYPQRFFDGSLQIEEYNGNGEYKDSHEDSIMRLQAEKLVELNHLLQNKGEVKNIKKRSIPKDKLWENPPQAVFDFTKTNEEDEWIRCKAARAKEILDETNSQNIILSHEDWSNKHFRFKDGNVAVIYDWDSIKWIDEFYSLGLACCTYTATWYYKTKIFPAKKEAIAFIKAYESYSGRIFSKNELEIISAYSAYTITYITRCVFTHNNGTIHGNDIEQPFNEIENGMYF